MDKLSHFSVSSFINHFPLTNRRKGSVTEAIYDFVVTPPRAQIGLKRSKKSEHLRPFVYRAVDF